MSKILICDDEPDIVNALKIYLESEGYETVSAENGKKALELLKQENVQLVLLARVKSCLRRYLMLGGSKDGSSVGEDIDASGETIAVGGRVFRRNGR